VLLSALVFPGLGQLADGHWARALLFAGSVLALLLALARRVWIETRARLPDDPAVLLDPAWPFRLAHEIQQAQASFFFWITAGLLAVWVGSAVEAWFSSGGGVSAVSPEGPWLQAAPGRSVRFCSHCGAPLSAPPPVTCAACGIRHWRNARPCAGALVTHAGRLLLVRRAHEPWRGLWDIPGGFCGPEEHPRVTAAREVREETGLSVEVGEILGMWMDRYAASGENADKTTLNIYFQASVDGDARSEIDPNEVAEIAWFGPGELPRELAFPDHVPAVLRAWKRSHA